VRIIISPHWQRRWLVEQLERVLVRLALMMVEIERVK
jgi:hypothetical protein